MVGSHTGGDLSSVEGRRLTSGAARKTGRRRHGVVIAARSEEEEKGRDPLVPPPVQTAAAFRSRPRPPVASMAQAPPSYDDVEPIDSPINVGVSRPSIERAHREMVSDIDAQLEAEQPRAPINYGQMDPADVATSSEYKESSEYSRLEFRNFEIFGK